VREGKEVSRVDDEREKGHSQDGRAEKDRGGRERMKTRTRRDNERARASYYSHTHNERANENWIADVDSEYDVLYIQK
jgi:hypothetical protein